MFTPIPCNPLNPGSLLFAPMEGITDEIYRRLILKHYPEWDFVATDFLRIPGVSSYPEKHLIKHFGTKSFKQSNVRSKTIYQILTSETARTEEHVQMIKQLGVTWLDLNLGCPSKTVCGNRGGSFLLSTPDTLSKIIKQIRANFPHRFTAKIRVGYRDDSNFIEILKRLEDEGVDAITIHARTRDELYKGVANWNYVKEAVKAVKIPIIGNGDIWSVSDINKYFDFTQCHSIMLGRSALKTPWLCQDYKIQKRDSSPLERTPHIQKYFLAWIEALNQTQLQEEAKLRRMKATARYIFDDYNDEGLTKKNFLRSKTLDEVESVLNNLQH